MEVYDKQDIEASMSCIDRRLHELVSCDAQRFVVRIGNKPLVHTRMQALFNLKLPTELQRLMYEVVLGHGVAAEKLGPGGFGRFLELLHCILSDHREGLSAIEPRHARLVDVEKLADAYGTQGSKMIPAMLKESLKLAGFAGRIIVEKSSSPVPSVELIRGYGFDLLQMLPIDFNLTHARIVCIDGHVEQVSEIHHLLEAASSSKEPLVIFLRGASDDVKHTLKVNYDRGSLRVIPIGVRFDLEGMNTLVDLATVAGSDVVSSLKGDLINNIDFNTLPVIDQVTMFRGRVVLGVSRTAKVVRGHVANLRRRRSEEKLDDVAALLDKRIKSLSPNHVVVRLPDDKDFVVNSQAIDYALRAIRAAIERGVNAAGVPVVTELAARHHAQMCAGTLRDLGACIH